MKYILTYFILFFVLFSYGNKITKAYKALSIYNYFEAKRLFEKTIKKQPAYASFGLATIYSRTDNPFSQVDSAAKYITHCKHAFKDTVSYSRYSINQLTIETLAQIIANRGFEDYRKINTIQAYTYYLKNYEFASEALKQKCYQLRDSIAFENYQFYESSDSIQTFLTSYPQSVYHSKAQALYYDLQFREQVPNNQLQQLKRFIKHYSSNPHVADAENIAYQQTLQLHQADSLYAFIKQYSTNKTSEQAWKALYSLSVKNYGTEELSRFSAEHPDYPYSQNLLKEISLAQHLLLPIKTTNEKFGYIDTLGNWLIEPQFDDADFFSEGFATVCKNDTCYYINKEGKKVSDLFFDEVESYHQGVAIVKKDKWVYLVNRSSQLISKGFEDINQSSDFLFVAKSNSLYGAINVKGETIIPFVYHKLGDFKNGYAYYQSDKYGLINTQNKALKAEWDWVSDVDTNHIVIVKKDNQFGLLNTDGEIILSPQYDYIEPCSNHLYLVVKQGLYGFYNSKELCYATAIEYDYNKAYKADEYTTGKYFKLLKNNEISLVDANGRYSINFGTYTNLFFAKCEIIRIQKNNKFGFVDRKLKPITPVEFDKATDFDNDVAIVSKGNKTMLINTDGKMLYQLKDGNIEKINERLYQISNNDVLGLVNHIGETLVLKEYVTIQKNHSHFYICTKPDGSLYLWNEATKKIIKL